MLQNKDDLERRDWLRGSLTDEEVLQRVGRGEPELFELLMRRYNQRLFRVVRAYLSDDLEAEEVVQQAYVVAFQNLESFEGRSSYATWQTRIAINEALARQRRLRRRGDLLEDLKLDTPEFAPESASPAERASSAELRELIEQCVDALSSEHRVVFMMRRVEGLDTEQTAELLGTTPAAVKARLHRANEHLRQTIARRLDLSVELGRAFAFDGARCDRIVASVLQRILPG